jgi:hypothetical protein
MPRNTRITRTQVLALPRPQPVLGGEWLVAAVAVALLLAGLLV